MSSGFVIEFCLATMRIGGPESSEEQDRFRVLIKGSQVRAFEEFRDQFGEATWVVAQDGIIALAIGGFIKAEARVWRDLPNGLRLVNIGTIERDTPTTTPPTTSSFIGPTTDSIGMFCAKLDVAMARRGGWTEDDIATTWVAISTAVSATNRRVAFRIGHTRQCPDCECWTVPDGPCHLCTAR